MSNWPVVVYGSVNVSAYVLFTNGDWVSMATAQRAIHKAEVDSLEGQTAIAVTVHKVCTEYEVR